MTLKELKAILNNLPVELENVEVISCIPVGCCGDTEILEGLTVEHFKSDNPKSSFVRLDYGTIMEGHRSCRQRSATLKEDREYWEQFPSSFYGKLYLKEKEEKNGK